MAQEPNTAGRGRRARMRKALPWLWLGLSAVWAVVIFTTDQLAWPLALWVATTLGPLTALARTEDPTTGKQDRERRNSESSREQIRASLEQDSQGSSQ